MEYDCHDYDSATNVSKNIVEGAKARTRLLNQSQFQQSFNRFIETLHSCYQQGNPTETVPYLRRFAEFLKWTKQGVHIKKLYDCR